MFAASGFRRKNRCEKGGLLGRIAWADWILAVELIRLNERHGGRLSATALIAGGN